LIRIDVHGPINRAGEAWATLIECHTVGQTTVIDGGAAGQQGHRPGRAAVVLERAEEGINIEQIGLRIAAPAGRVADQIVALGERDGAVEVGGERSRGASQNRASCVERRQRRSSTRAFSRTLTSATQMQGSSKQSVVLAESVEYRRPGLTSP